MTSGRTPLTLTLGLANKYAHQIQRQTDNRRKRKDKQHKCCLYAPVAKGKSH